MPKDRQRPEKSRSILSVGSLKLTATCLNMRLRHAAENSRARTSANRWPTIVHSFDPHADAPSVTFASSLRVDWSLPFS